MKPLVESDVSTLPLLFRGKVRDVYDLGDHLLIVASDRLSAFDVVLPTPIPHKGTVLTQLSNFWFARTSGIVPNHLAHAGVDRYFRDPGSLAALEGRSVVVRKAEPIRIEAFERLTGRTWPR